MSKNVLIISSSPRKGGDSDALCDQFMKGAKEAGNRVNKIRLAELSIDYCSACYACKKLGHCVKQDDMEQVIVKMREADVKRKEQNSMKKITAILLSAALVLSLAACGNDNQTTAEDNSSKTAAAATESADGSANGTCRE